MDAEEFCCWLVGSHSCKLEAKTLIESILNVSKQINTCSQNTQNFIGHWYIHGPGIFETQIPLCFAAGILGPVASRSPTVSSWLRLKGPQGPPAKVVNLANFMVHHAPWLRIAWERNGQIERNHRFKDLWLLDASYKISRGSPFKKTHDIIGLVQQGEFPGFLLEP